MALKYEKLDTQLCNWLRQNQKGVTTTQAIRALHITDTTAQRHISRRFSQLEDRGVLKCEIVGTTRVCQVIAQVPFLLSKQRAFIGRVVPNSQNIPAANSDEFLAAGGVIERVPSAWTDGSVTPIRGSLPLGEMSAGIRQFRNDLDD